MPYRQYRKAHYGPSEEENLRVVFQYSGLLEADPFSGGYKKVIPDRLVDPGRLVTWTPPLRGEYADDSSLIFSVTRKPWHDVSKTKKKVAKKKIVTWMPDILGSKVKHEESKDKITDVITTFTQISNSDEVGENIARKEIQFEQDDNLSSLVKPVHVNNLHCCLHTTITR